MKTRTGCRLFCLWVLLLVVIWNIYMTSPSFICVGDSFLLNVSSLIWLIAAFLPNRSPFIWNVKPFLFNTSSFIWSVESFLLNRSSFYIIHYKKWGIEYTWEPSGLFRIALRGIKKAPEGIWICSENLSLSDMLWKAYRMLDKQGCPHPENSNYLIAKSSNPFLIP